VCELSKLLLLFPGY